MARKAAATAAAVSARGGGSNDAKTDSTKEVDLLQNAKRVLAACLTSRGATEDDWLEQERVLRAVCCLNGMEPDDLDRGKMRNLKRVLTQAGKQLFGTTSILKANKSTNAMAAAKQNNMAYKKWGSVYRAADPSCACRDYISVQ